MNNQVQDQFKEYFSEKLWEMIPAVYRHEDGVAANPGVLRAFVEVLAEQAAIVRRSHDRLWDDQFIELCDDWAVPYIADLVGTRLVSALNKRGRRVDVAKTIYYRRRKGTLRILEELISDVAGWEGIVLENFRRLGRARHGLDPHPGPLTGRISGTLPGGWADLRRPRAAEVAGGPFDEFHYTPDVRRHRGARGRYSIPKLAFHLYRMPSFSVDGVTPFRIGTTGRFTFDPSGRDVPLFAPRSRVEHDYNWDQWQTAREWELPVPIRCRVLADSEGKEALIPNAIHVAAPPVIDLNAEQVIAANLSSWIIPSVDQDIAIDPERGRFVFTKTVPTEPMNVTYNYGFSGEIGAGTYDRRHVEDLTINARKAGGGPIIADDMITEGVFQIDDSATYDMTANPAGNIKKLTIQAANQQRPYVRLTQPWKLNGESNVGSNGEDACLIIDGLWIGCNEIILSGNYEAVIIRYSTLDPGGLDAAGNSIPPVSLVVEGFVETLVIKRSITGALKTRNNGQIQLLVIEDSIVQRTQLDQDPVICLPDNRVKMERVTVFGKIEVKQLQASESIITGGVLIRDVQSGCFRFSASPEDNKLSLPKPFKAFWIPETGSAHYFTSRRFGDPGYAQLSAAAPIELMTWAENGSEIGAFSGLMTPIRLESLNAKVNEYMPFGLIPIYIAVT